MSENFRALPDTPLWREFVAEKIKKESRPRASKRKAAIRYPRDPVIEEVLNKIKDRADEGLKKYGKPMTRDDISTVGWIDHAIEELLDAANYLTRLKRDLP